MRHFLCRESINTHKKRRHHRHRLSTKKTKKPEIALGLLKMAATFAFGTAIAKTDTANAKSVGDTGLRSPHKTSFAGTPK